VNITDAQVHIFGPGEEEKAAQVGQRPLQADQVLAEMDAAGVARAVVVAGGSRGNQVALEAARDHPDRFAVMGGISLNKPESHELIKTWREQPGMLGIRLSFPPWRESWLKNRTADWIWPAAGALGIPVMVWPPEQVGELARVAGSWPECTIIVDHMGLYVDVVDDQVGDKLPPLLDLARFGNVAVKVSALPCHSTHEYPYRNLHPFLRQVVAAFGPRRCFWGTDLTRLPGTYRQAVTMFTEELGLFSDEDLEWVMGRGISAWLGWDS
jgi:predicted TIM-barrel fold metal-dependent hydrolase